jgi:hypothetical protein
MPLDDGSIICLSDRSPVGQARARHREATHRATAH